MMLRFLALASVLVLAACGFTPVYGDRAAGSVNAALETVAISNIPDRDGQYLRNLLIDRFYRVGRPATPNYVLEVAPIVESRRDLDETIESDTTRQQIRLDTSLVLTDTRTNQVLLQQPLRAIGSYNVLSSEYTTRVSRAAVRDDVLADLARQIETRVGLYLRSAGP